MSRKRSQLTMKQDRDKQAKKAKMLTIGTQTDRTPEELRNLVVRQIKG